MITYSPADGVRLALHLLPADEGVVVRLVAGDDPAAITAEAHTVLQHIEEVQRMASQAAFHDDVGRGLFRSLLPGALGDRFREVYTQATVSGARLTLELHITPALVRLARYPWELLHDGTRFLLQTGAVDLVRLIPYPAPYPEPVPYVADTDEANPLRVLIATATPDDHPPLAGSYDALERDFVAQQRADAIDIAPLYPPTWDALMDWLLAGGPDVFQVESHADFTRTGRLLFEDAGGKVDPVASDLLVSALGSANVRLMLLNAGVTGFAGSETLLSSAAATLILLGLPAVIAAQHTLPQADGIAFAEAVYMALLAGEDVESAVLAGRRALKRSPYWYVPVLTRRRVVPFPEAGARLSQRVYTAAASRVQTGWTTRAALWLVPTQALPPTTGDVGRMVGEAIGPHEPDIVPQSCPAEELPEAYPPGVLEVRLTAPCCDVHTRARTLTLCADREVPPVWFALTPRRPGPVTLTFELWRGSHQLGAVSHALDASTDAPDHAGRPVLLAHGGADTPAQDITATGEHPATAVSSAYREPSVQDEPARDRIDGPDRESHDDHDRDTPLSHPPAQQNPIPGAPQEPEQFPRAFDGGHRAEALDGVLDALQTGLPPESADNPVEDPSTRARREARIASDMEAMIDTMLVAMQVTPDASAAAQEEDTRLGDLPPVRRLVDHNVPVVEEAQPSLDALTREQPAALSRAGQIALVAVAVVIVVIVVLSLAW